MHHKPHIGEPQRGVAGAQVELMLSADGDSGELLDWPKRAENTPGRVDTDCSNMEMRSKVVCDKNSIINSTLVQQYSIAVQFSTA